MDGRNEVPAVQAGAAARDGEGEGGETEADEVESGVVGVCLRNEGRCCGCVKWNMEIDGVLE